MTIYRRLSLEELQLLEKEFIQFLVVQGIEANTWVKLKEENLTEANQLIDNFSDMVLETSLKKIKYLDFISPKKIMSYQCLTNNIVVVIVEAPNNSNIDFTKQVSFAEYKKHNSENIVIYTSNKKYHPTRELELFKLTESGCLVSDGQLFKSLSLQL